MTRVKRSVHAKKKRRATLERAKGFRGEANSNYKRAKEARHEGGRLRYRDRRNRKRDFRRLWITRINAAARQNGMTYGDLHPRPPARRHRAGPQGAGRHRRARPRDLPPIRRRRPRGVGCLTSSQPTHRTSRAPLLSQDGALFFAHDHHQPPQRQAQGDPQARAAARARRTRRASSPRARTSSPPRPRRAGSRSRCWRRPAAAWTATRSSRRCWTAVSGARLGQPRRSASTSSAGRAPAGPLCVALWGVGDPGNVGTILRSRARLRRGVGRARARAAPTRSARRPCGRRWARSSRCRSRGRRRRRAAGRADRARRRARASRCAGPAGGERHARRRRRARRACPPTSSRRATASRTSRSRSESLNAAMAATVALYELTRRVARA